MKVGDKLGNNNEALKSLIDGILLAVDNKIKKAKYDKTIKAKITNVIAQNLYEVTINGNKYNIKSNYECNINDFVNILIPQNNYKNMFIIPDIQLQLDTKASKPTLENANLSASDWFGETAPYTQTVSIDEFVANNNCIFNLSKVATLSQYNTFANAKLHISGIEDGALIISAFGTLPTEDIPIEICIIG